MVKLVFVYGTLRRGEVNHYWLEGASYVGTCQIASGWHLYNLGLYPAVMSDTQSTTPLTGEVYQVTPAVMQKLDELEEYPSLYGREIVDTPLGQAWIYYYQQMDAGQGELIPSGDWLNRD